MKLAKEKEKKDKSKSRVRSALSILLNLFGIIFIIIGVLAILFAILFSILTKYVSSSTFSLFGIRSLISSVFNSIVLIAITGIIFGFLFILSRKWLKSEDKNGILLSALLSVTLLLFFILFAMGAASFGRELALVFVAIFGAMSVLSILSFNEVPWKSSVLKGVVPYVVGILIVFAVFEFTSLNGGNLIASTIMQSMYSPFLTNITFSSKNISYTYPSSWQSFSFPLSVNKSLVSTVHVPFSAFPNMTVNLSLEVLVPRNIWWNLASISNLTSLLSRPTYIYSNVSNTRSIALPFSAIVIGTAFVGAEGQSLFNNLTQNLSNALGINLNQPLPINISAQANAYFKEQIAKNNLNVNYSSLGMYIANISGARGYKIYLYNFTFQSNQMISQYLAMFKQYAYAVTVKNGELCFVLGLSNINQAQMLTAFNNIVGTLNCK